MKKVNNRWVDAKNNSWNCNLYTKEQAEEYSKSLIDCRDCSSCTYCSSCSECRDCSSCRDCSYCRDCRDCSYCRDCRDCSYCLDCSSCRDCLDCSSCRDCRDCTYCSSCCDCKKQPQIYMTKRIGSRDASTFFYKNNRKVFVSCGCFHGTLADFEARVKEVYPVNNKYRIQYLKEIKKVKTLWEK